MAFGPNWTMATTSRPGPEIARFFLPTAAFVVVVLEAAAVDAVVAFEGFDVVAFPAAAVVVVVAAFVVVVATVVVVGGGLSSVMVTRSKANDLMPLEVT